MKRILGILLSAIIAVQAGGFINNDALAASKHRHSYKTFAHGIGNNDKHQTIRKCTSCGNVSRTGTTTHSRGTVLGYEKYNERYHYKIFQCKADGCNESFKKTYSHSWRTLDPVDYNETYHTVTKQCKDCGQTKSELKKHSYSRGTCKCGHSKSSGITATNKNKQGVCYSVLGKYFNDNWVYSRCPKCNSSNWRMDYIETIGKTGSVWSGYRVVKHQHVICECGNKYTNKCYEEHEDF